MNVRFAPRAVLEAERKNVWWRENRDESALFDDELVATLEAVRATPTLGADYPSNLGVPVRRVLMARTATHLYFTVTATEIVVLSVWGASRRRGPRL